MYSCGAIDVAVVEDAIPPPTTNAGTNMTVGKGIVVDEVATHLPMERGNNTTNYKPVMLPFYFRGYTIHFSEFCVFSGVHYDVKSGRKSRSMQ